MKQLIINADDFGMSEAFNYGVIKAYKDGIVSSTSIMINMEAAEHALMLSKSCPSMFIGQHTNFVLGKSCADPEKIPSMVDENGFFHRSSDYRLGKRKFVYEEVKIETIAQMERFKKLTGNYPEHIEGHAVGGEVVDQAFLDISKDFGIHTSILNSMNNINTTKKYKKVEPILTSEYWKIINNGVSVKNFINDDIGILNVDDDKVVELHFHPGYLDQFILENSSLTLPRCKDLSTLCDSRVKHWIKINDIELIDFKDLEI